MRLTFVIASFAATLALPARAADPSQLAPPYGLPALERADFNRLANVAGAPLFWRSDTENPGVIDPTELAVLGGKTPLEKFVQTKKKEASPPTFTREFERTYRALVELRRREAVKKELDQGRPTLIETDISSLSGEDKAIVKKLLEAARQIDALYEIQIGAAGLSKKVPKDDLASQALIARNHGPWCEAPLTQADPFCNALPTFPERVTFAWPEDKVDQAFCDKMAAEPNGKDLTAPFTVVRKNKKGGYRAEPYTSAYRAPMKAVAATLRAAAKLVKSADEAAFKAYLLAAAKAFEDNDWTAADEAWAAMSAENSKYYLRIAPDETYWDPCGVKAGFHMSFALVDKGALEWKNKLTALRGEMEQRLAALIGAPYAARDVGFELPEFINVVMNAGDSRAGLGATVGQSLPNFGKVAEESRGRTVAMINIYTDADSLADFGKRDASLFTEATFASVSKDASAEHLSTVLHEATHNLGPNGAYRVDGKRGEEIFGGPTDAILEELKAQTGALYYLPLLKDKGLIDDQALHEGYVASLAWGNGHIARGMFTGEGRPKTYSQLSAIQLGELMKAGAVTWVEGGGDDPGRFDVDFAKMPAAVEGLMKTVARIKATGDVQGAKALIEEHTSAAGLAKIHADVITERVLRYPRASFVYGVKE